MTRDLAVDAKLEAEYNNMARRPDAGALLQQLAAVSASYRAEADSILDCRYGSHARETLDIFRCGRPHAPLFVYLHGGYWQRGDKSIYSYIAQPFNRVGVDVAVIGYPLCPEVSMTGLAQSLRKAIIWLYRNAASHGIDPDRINLSGHSAGGHLTALALATRWPELERDQPADLLKTAIPISGLYLLEPLRHTTIGEALQLTDSETRDLSPALLSAAHAAPMLTIVGGAETSAFFHQADSLQEAWSRPGLIIERYTEPDADHFDVVARLQSGDSAIFQRIVDWLS